ncbi:polysaccharide lyase [Streptomyces xanthophaeus]|uniref:polysaccharide lyase n=1 Tax=Streptomyces xanthophaeus TaxID=67385 RepID=UPI0037138DA9
MFHRYSRRRLTGVVLAAVVTMGGASIGTAVAKAPTPVPFADGFESGGTAQWPREGIEGAGTVAVVGAPGGRSGKAARFTMPDDGQSFRSEIATSRIPYGSYRYTFANYLPADWISYGNMTIVSQWHGGTDTIPAVALAVKADRWVLNVHWQVGSQPVQEVKLDLGPVQFGQWNQWSFDITWSTGTTPGSITARRNGAEVGSHRGPNSYHQDTAPYHKIGLYRPNWKASKGHVKGGTPAVVIYYDDIGIASISPGQAQPVPTPTAPAPAEDSASLPPVPSTASASASAPASDSAPATASHSTATGPASGATSGDAAAGATGGPLARTGTSGAVPLLLAFSGALLAAGLIIARRGRPKAAGRRGRHA